MKRSSDLSRRDALVGLAGAALSHGGCGAGPEVEGPHPVDPTDGLGWNLLFICSDEHNARHMGCAGNAFVQTPHMDRLAREGCRVPSTYAADPACAPARASMLTGLFPQEHGQLSNDHVLDASVPTLANFLASQGWVTGLAGKSHTNNRAPEASFGFKYRFDTADPQSTRFIGKERRRTKNGVLPPADAAAFAAIADKRLRGMPILAKDGAADGLSANMAERFIQEHAHERWFLHASFASPHWPWDLPEKWYHLYNPDEVPLPAWVEGDLDDSRRARWIQQRNGWDRMTEQQHRVCLARYLGAVSYMDAIVGRLLGLLDDLDLARRTLVIYTSDHGDMAAEKRMWLKSLMFDGACRIPFLARMPGRIEPGSVPEILLSQTAFPSTFCHLLGATEGLRPLVDGRDRSAALLGRAGEGERDEKVYAINYSPRTSAVMIRMVRTSRWKLIHGPGVGEHPEELELYDMVVDPEEILNLAADPAHAEILAGLLEAEARWTEGMTPTSYTVVVEEVKPRGEAEEGADD